MDGLTLAMAILIAAPITAFVLGVAREHRYIKERRIYRTPNEKRPIRRMLIGGLRSALSALILLGIPGLLVVGTVLIADLMGLKI